MKKKLEITYPDGRVQIIEGENLRVDTGEGFLWIIEDLDIKYKVVAILSFECSVVDLSYVAEVKETVEEIPQPIPIKETGHLGITLDTERPWNTGEPDDDRVVEVKLKDGTIKKGWLGSQKINWYVDDNSPSAYTWPPASPGNPVVAWRELE